MLLTGVLVKFKIGLRPIDPALAEAQQSAAAAASAAVAAENDMHRGSQAHNLRHTLTSKGGSTIYASSTVSQRTLSTNKSFRCVINNVIVYCLILCLTSVHCQQLQPTQKKWFR